MKIVPDKTLVKAIFHSAKFHVKETFCPTWTWASWTNTLNKWGPLKGWEGVFVFVGLIQEEMRRNWEAADHLPSTKLIRSLIHVCAFYVTPRGKQSHEGNAEKWQFGAIKRVQSKWSVKFAHTVAHHDYPLTDQPWPIFNQMTKFWVGHSWSRTQN